MTATETVLQVSSYVGLVLLAGMALFWLYFWPEGHWIRTFSTIAWSGWTICVAGAGGLIWIGAIHQHRGLKDEIATLAGTALTIRLALLLIAAAWLFEVGSTYAATPYRAMASLKVLTGGVTLLLMPVTFVPDGWTIHESWAAVKAVLATSYVAAMTLWLGGLVVVAVEMISPGEVSHLRALLRRFTIVAIVCVGVLIVSMPLYALSAPSGSSGLVHSAVGALVLIALVALYVAVGAAKQHFQIRDARVANSLRTRRLSTTNDDNRTHP